MGLLELSAFYGFICNGFTYGQSVTTETVESGARPARARPQRQRVCSTFDSTNENVI